ncbi:MAG: porin [Bacteroidia bacterium]
MKLKPNYLLTLLSAVVVTALSVTKVSAQETNEEPIDTIARAVHKLQDDFAALKKLKISGYIQANFQYADSMGVPSFQGGNFPANTDKRFAVRRGRLKFVYDNVLTQYVLQFQASETGVSMKEGYVKFTEPWMKAVSVQMGIFDVPFGFEAPNSSSAMESPERGRMSQTLLPDENDLGGMVTFQMPKTSPLNFLKIEAGMFNGTQAKASDFDFQKDFIGRISIARASKSEKIKYGIGASYYNGGVRNGRKNVYSMDVDSAGLASFKANTDTLNYGRIAQRQYMGVDAQVYFDFPFGITTLKAEYIQGIQPGTSGTLKSPSAQPTTDTYLRKFNGAYFYFIQNIMQTKHQIIVKYDWFDPNTDVAGDDLGKAILTPSGKTYAKTGVTDIKFTTLGLGYAYKWDNNVKITLWYDMVTNETSKNLVSKGYWKDIPDNVFTLRFQYKF